MLVAWLLAIHAIGGYRRDVFGAGTDEFKRVANASLSPRAASGIGCYLAKFQLSRGFFLLVFVIGIPALVLGRLDAPPRAALAPAGAAPAPARGDRRRSRAHVDEVAQRAAPRALARLPGRRRPHARRRPQRPRPRPASRCSATPTSCSPWSRTSRPTSSSSPAAPSAPPADLRRMVWELENKDVQVVMAPERHRRRRRPGQRPPGRRAAADPPGAAALGGRPRWAKRTFDVVGSRPACCWLRPGLRCSPRSGSSVHDGGPVLFRQTRVGRDGGSFRCLKFRTMVVDAEALLAELHRRAGLRRRPVQDGGRPADHHARPLAAPLLPRRAPAAVQRAARRHEPGRARDRRCRREVARYDDDIARRLRVRPGMTGLWQVSGRSDLSWAEADPPRPLLRRQLVDAAGPPHPGPRPSAPSSAPAAPTEARSSPVSLLLHLRPLEQAAAGRCRSRS